jgi:hypothetical protein
MSSTQFNNVFANGTDEQIQEQLKLWQTGRDSSVFVRWVPDELQEEEAKEFFSKYGKVDRVDLVPKMVNNKKVGTMAFVHFGHWNSVYNHPESTYVVDTTFEENIVKQYPNPYEVDWHYTNEFGKTKTYKLKCCVNTRPIAKVEFNASQLTDMFQRLNADFAKLTETFQEENSELHKRVGLLKEENATLRARMAIFELKLASVAKPPLFAGLRPNALEFTPNH